MKGSSRSGYFRPDTIAIGTEEKRFQQEESGELPLKKQLKYLKKSCKNYFLVFQKKNYIYYEICLPLAKNHTMFAGEFDIYSFYLMIP